MKPVLKSLLLLFSFATLISNTVVSQPSPTGHAQIWANVEAYWSQWAKRNLEGYLEYVDDSYSGWNYDAPMHRSKKSTREWMEHSFQSTEVLVYDISAIDIKIHENIAIVHYYYSILERDANGVEVKSAGRKSDVLKRHGDKWLIIADHGGTISKD